MASLYSLSPLYPPFTLPLPPRTSSNPFYERSGVELVATRPPNTGPPAPRPYPAVPPPHLFDWLGVRGFGKRSPVARVAATCHPSPGDRT